MTEDKALYCLLLWSFVVSCYKSLLKVGSVSIINKWEDKTFQPLSYPQGKAALWGQKVKIIFFFIYSFNK